MNYQYITQEIIEEGTINITSAAMYAEAEQYNKRMKLFYQKKRLFPAAILSGVRHNMYCWGIVCSICRWKMNPLFC